MQFFELLQRRIGFLPLEEYLTRYPHTDPSIFSPEAGRMAMAMAEKWQSIDPSSSTEANIVFVKNMGTGWDANDVKKVMMRELTKVPRGVEV